MSGDDPQLLGPVGVIELWREPSRLWRWRYLEPSGDGRPLAFLSNKAYESQQAALHSATTAYPGVAVLQRDTPAGGGRRPNRHRLLLLALVAVAVLLLWPRQRRRRPAPEEVAAP